MTESIEKQLNDELTDAMKSGDRARVAVIRQVRTEVSVARSAPGFDGEIDDDLYRKTISAYMKKMEKARKEFEEAGDRGREQADKLAFEVEYLSRWVPDTSLGEEETRALVKAKVEELGADSPKQIGMVIGAVMKSGADVDGATVNRIVRQELGA